uniref:Ubiquitin-like protease family profile domain-containing protein n=1 Tax=Chenopodium quinoa TaxID=63459 RepID=A0A803L9F3_CHEQI
MVDSSEVKEVQDVPKEQLEEKEEQQLEEKEEQQMEENQESKLQEQDEESLPLCELFNVKGNVSKKKHDDMEPIVDPQILRSIETMVQDIPKNTAPAKPARKPATDKVVEEGIVEEGGGRKIVLRKRRAPLGEPMFPVMEKHEVGVSQSISQSKAESTIVSVPKPKNKRMKTKDDKEDEQKVAIVQIKDLELKQRHTVKPLQNLVKTLQSTKQEDKLQAIENMGFGGFLHLDMPKGTPKYSATLVENLEVDGLYFLCDKNKKIDIQPIDAHLVYGLPIGGEEIKDAALEDEVLLEVMKEVKAYSDGSIPNLTDLAGKLGNPDTPLDDNWKRSFLLIVVNSCIKSVSNTQPFYRFMYTAADTNKISKFDWSSYTVESLKEMTIYWKGDRKRFFPGPLPFVTICYFDRLKRGTSSFPREIPLVKEWNGDMIKERINLEEYTLLLRQATERIAEGFVNLSNVLKLGERFHGNTLYVDTTLLNVSTMSAKCSGIKFSQENQKNIPTQREEGTSILSQDTDFFASDWFGEMVDNVFKMAGFEENTKEFGDNMSVEDLEFRRRELNHPHLNQFEWMYDDGHTNLTREMFRTLGDNVYLYTDIIDAWALILNSRNFVDDKKRIFFANNAFFFFPVYVSVHFYVVVINTRTKTVDILDNRPLADGIPMENKYFDYPEKLRNALGLYLQSKDIKIGENMSNYPVKLVQMPWRTEKNNIDCGVYAMRHMETYFGKKKWTCGLKANNFDALKKLRLRYTYELITTDLNMKKPEMCARAKKHFKELGNI